MAGKILQAAVVGAGTLLGKELLDEISNSAAAVWDLRLFGDGEETEGQLTSVGDEALVMRTVANGSFTGLDLVMFAGDREEARRFGPLAVKAGAAVVDLTGALQGSEGFLLHSALGAGQSAARPDDRRHCGAASRGADAGAGGREARAAVCARRAERYRSGAGLGRRLGGRG